MSDEAVEGDDGLWRCGWAADDPLLRTYHDIEWGVPLHGERALFERIVLEGFQAGLSWRIVLAKRPAFRAAFAGFDPDVVAAMDDGDLEALLEDPSIIRNRAKIAATRTNARAVVAMRSEGGLDALIWSHRPAPPTDPHAVPQVLSSSPESIALAKSLKKRGCAFVGPTTAYALMEAIGMIDGHLPRCHRRGIAAVN